MPTPEDPLNTPDNAPTPRPLPRLMRWLLHGVAVLCLGLAVIGVIVPGMPTTVFVLIAAWAAARSSPKLYRWLWNHRVLGPPLRNWTQGGCVSRRAKWSATLVMGLSSAILIATASRTWVWMAAIGCMACVLAWLWRRPEPR